MAAPKTNFVAMLEPALALDMMTMMESLSPCYFSVTVLAECAGLTETRAAIALMMLKNFGLASYKALEGFCAVELKKDE